jgi:hypothetical protein
MFRRMATDIVVRTPMPIALLKPSHEIWQAANYSETRQVSLVFTSIAEGLNTNN